MPVTAPVFANTADPEDMALAMIITLTSNQRREQRRGFKGPGGTRGRPRIHPLKVTIEDSEPEGEEARGLLRGGGAGGNGCSYLVSAPSF